MGNAYGINCALCIVHKYKTQNPDWNSAFVFVEEIPPPTLISYLLSLIPYLLFLIS